VGAEPNESTSGVETGAEWYNSVVEHSEVSVPDPLADDHRLGPAMSMLPDSPSGPTRVRTTRPNVIEALGPLDATTSAPAGTRMGA
jgi:hypothetical protein